jgi:4-hydroxy-3-polyprenylbenzoate decarboxylase
MNVLFHRIIFYFWIMGKKIVVAITGASGSIYAKRFLEKLNTTSTPIENCSVVFSKNARDIWAYELKEPFDVNCIPFKVFEPNDFYAPFASGSSGYDAMVIIPCSMGTLGRIAAGISDDLITRTADVILKERGKLIVVPRETPYNLIHLRNMVTLTEAGAIVMPATPSFYSLPANIDEVVDTVVNRVLDLTGIANEGFKWGEVGTQRFTE